MKLIMMKGLPASGKTTWAKALVNGSDGQVKRVNKDDLRAMIDNGQWSKHNETMILQARDALISLYMCNGYDVVVDDTNLAPKHEQAFSEYCAHNDFDFEVQDFTNVPLQTCIDRDSARQNSVGKKVIRNMHRQFLKGQYTPYKAPEHDPDLPTCIIVDIDGTLAHMTGRSPYDYSRVSEDQLDEAVAGIVRLYADRDYPVIIVSGRESICRPETEQWLRSNVILYTQLYMRAAGDDRNDAIVKQEIYEQHIKGKYNVKFVLDDRDRVVKMWRDNGLKVLQVAEGNF